MTFKQETLDTPLFDQEKNKATLGDPSLCELEETLKSKRPLEFLNGFTHDTAAFVKRLTGAAFPRLTEGRRLDAVNL